MQNHVVDRGRKRALSKLRCPFLVSRWSSSYASPDTVTSCLNGTGAEREDDQAYSDKEEHVKVHANVSTASIYDMLTEQEKYYSRVGTKLYIMLAAQERYTWTVDNNPVQEAAQEHQPLLRLSLSTNGGVTNVTAAGVGRHRGKKPDDKRPGI